MTITCAAPSGTADVENGLVAANGTATQDGLILQNVYGAIFQVGGQEPSSYLNQEMADDVGETSWSFNGLAGALTGTGATNRLKIWAEYMDPLDPFLVPIFESHAFPAFTGVAVDPP